MEKPMSIPLDVAEQNGSDEEKAAGGLFEHPALDYGWDIVRRQACRRDMD
jgi:hypothetical protein